MYASTAYTTVPARTSLHSGLPPAPPPHPMAPQMYPTQQAPAPPRTQFPEPVRQYVQRAFAESNNVEGVNRADIEAKLKQVISQAAEQRQLDTIDWASLPLPQQMIYTERTASYMPPAPNYAPWQGFQSTGTYTNNSSFDSPRKRKSGDLSTDDPSGPLPPWRQQQHQQQMQQPQAQTRSLESRITMPSKRQKSEAQAQAKQSKADLDREKRKQRFQNKNGKQVANRELDPEQIILGPVIGRSQTLEKKYLRLTSAPNPEFVRPLDVLRKTLDFLKRKWREEGNYKYICDQFKSLRQDLTVQHIKNEFTVTVYEIHARIALEKGDMGEYNQCQSQLRALYAEHLGGHPVEFQAYRILYFLFTANRMELSDILAELTPAEKQEPAIKHALAARSALALGNYHRFFKLYLETPNMGAYLLDKFVDRERLAALARICKTYKPDLPLRFVTEELAFESDGDAAKFICERGSSDYLEERDDGVRFLSGKVGNVFDAAAKAAAKKVDLKGQQ